ncbi:ATP-grasp domain-containing protein [Salipaludibacillus sp. CUR1]|uniref:acetyl-CoA carboxylase biotin carboxylase subunit n=1 Tax=Salipaludibacillus sp. CUR1 TaxID=2820003 RepID=UPI001E374F89|nr:biotin carboxylase N-terminal domain-containing protein [Salipaludibacillus sp. CUR1]MCE7793694.1 ATP-grasp domain-containing protein [Salipaludibacillus sp. CUR1]
MIKKILIANRGEIACRVIKTCKSLGIKTVAVFSEADQYSVHVSEADESYLVGGARVNESYLNQSKIIEAAKEAEVDAIHPGYGFLSENTEFAQKVQQEGIIFIGPSAEAIDKMGDKIHARKLMEEAGVPVVPGMTLKNTEEFEVITAAKKIGFPLMVKASAGGGGIGMQKVEHEDELMKAVQSVVKKAETFFGSADIFLEKYIEHPRHIEAQIAGDNEGHIVAVGSRDCSIQRRHQKIIEEAPPPEFSKEGNQRLLEEAIKAGKALNYTNVGTIEFLVDEEENIYFLEMNTRLQVEHPVTEETAGIDLVEWQIRLAEGQLIAEQKEGGHKAAHAIEVRIYAEDPKTFFPSPGTLKTWRFPEMDGIRYDFGVQEGTVVTPYYDPMIGKVIAFSDSRDNCIKLLTECLEIAEVEGIKTNIPMLAEALKDERFKHGKVNTHFVGQ